jgi:glyoxylate reductase
VAARVLVTRPIPDAGMARLREAGYELVENREDRVLEEGELRRLAAGCEGILCLLTDRIDGALLAAARGCRIVANMAVGYNNVDVAAASSRNVLVTNTPGVLTEATADLTWALILAVARRVVEGDAEMRGGRFPGWGPLYLPGGDVAGSTLGLIGPGRIAAAVARRAVGFRMKIVYHGRRPSPELDTLGARSTSLNELLEEADFVSLHVPLTAETHHLIDERALDRMKRTAYLINTARGPVVDEAALVRALRGGRIAGAGLDVYEDEPKMAAGLGDLPSAVLLPHLGSATKGTRGAMAEMAAMNLIAALSGKRPPNLVNPDVWRDDRTY